MRFAVAFAVVQRAVRRKARDAENSRAETSSALPSRITANRRIKLLYVVQHFLGGRSVAALRIQLEVLLQVGPRVGVLPGANVDHTEFVVGGGEFGVGGDGLFQ